MKFILGLLTGLVLGAVGAVAYSVQSGRDLREAYDEVMRDLDRRDFEALATRLEARFAEMQTQIETRIAQARERTTAAMGAAADAADEAAGTTDEVVAGVETPAGDIEAAGVPGTTGTRTAARRKQAD